MRMKSKLRQLRARDYINDLAASGHYHFLSSDAREALGVSAEATKLALNRLGRQNMIAQPARGFCVILPPEYRSLGCLPADQFIPALMQQLRQPYYAWAIVSRAVSRRSPPPAAGISGSARKGAPAHLLQPGTHDVHRPQAPSTGSRAELQHAPRHGSRLNTGGDGRRSRRLLPPCRWA